jgi:uncharacterized repeat protein (TIGR03847 family)
MAEEIEIDPTHALSVGTVGEPGHREFYIRARGTYRTLTMLVEKAQVAALCERAGVLLEGRDAAGARAEPFTEPADPDWRAGQMGLGLDPDRDLVVLVAQAAPETEDEDPDSLPTLRAWIKPAQMLAFAAEGVGLVAGGRPVCPICGLPMDPEGHVCPRKNGKSPVF